jgi:complex iron-sulfur molybdoenzyme family reductase subunit alpha
MAARQSGVSRRDFITWAGAAGLGAWAGCNAGGGSAGPPQIPGVEIDYDPLKTYPYRGWEELYRRQYGWDKVVRSTHSANCTGSCSWKIYVKDGVMVREEQAADYPPISSELPDYNPRGCQKGACFVEYVYGAQRVKTPLMRVGERGEGKWRRASWDEALGHIAKRLVDNVYQHGPDTNFFFSVIPAMSPVSFSGGARLAHFVGGVFLSFYDWYCDLPPGEPLTWGVQTEACECADWFNAKTIVLWGSNINATRIPDAHFAWEARYAGAKVVAIFPDYNPSSIHADLFLGVRPGSDATLALAVARALIEEGAVDLPYVAEQTDLPFLVVTHSRRFLRQSDLAAGGKEDVFYLWDEVTGKAVEAPGSMGSGRKELRLGGVKPAMSGAFTVKSADGTDLAVTTVFALLQEQLREYSLERAVAETGLRLEDLRELVRLMKRRPAMIVHGAGINHWYHNDLLNRALILLVALTGNVGKNGGGFNHYVGQERIWPEHGFKQLAFPRGPKKQRWQNTTLWTYVHSDQRDAARINGKPIDWYIAQSVKNGWMPLWPKQPDPIRPTRKPRALIVWRANYLNQAKGNEHILRSLWRDLDLIVDINYRMDTTALYADVVLPAGTYYEKTDINTTDCHSYVHPFSKVLEPLYESRTDWDIFAALARAIEKEARARGLAPFDDAALGWSRDFTKLYADWSDGGKLERDEAAVNFILEHSAETKGMTYESLKDGPRRFVATDPEIWNSDVRPGQAYTPFQHQVEDKRPWRTLTGRQQFYIDHPWYIELGEALPVAKEPLAGHYPLFWNTPHGRWSIHSTWRDNRYTLRLQRGLPIAYLNLEEAAKRGINDNDWVKIFNDGGACVVKVKLLPGEPPGRITMYHGWEKYLGFQHGGWQSLTRVRIKPTQLVGGYGHVAFKLNYWGPTGNNRDCRVEVARWDGPVRKSGDPETRRRT